MKDSKTKTNTKKGETYAIVNKQGKTIYLPEKTYYNLVEKSRQQDFIGLDPEEMEQTPSTNYTRTYKDKQTGQTKTYYTKYKFNIQELNTLKQIAFQAMQTHNNKLYKQPYNPNKKFITFKQSLTQLTRLPRNKALAYIDLYKQKQQLEQEAKENIRLTQLTEHQDKVDNYFKQVDLQQLIKLQILILELRENSQQSKHNRTWFNNLSFDQQETILNKIDNYLYQQQEILVGNLEAFNI